MDSSFCDKISCSCVRRFPSNKGVKEGTLLLKTLFCRYWLVYCEIGYMSKHAAYRNNLWWRVFQIYQHRWFWTTLNPQNRNVFREFLQFLVAAHISRVNWDEMAGGLCLCDVLPRWRDNLHMKFSALNADFSSPKSRFLRFKEACAGERQTRLA